MLVVCDSAESRGYPSLIPYTIRILRACLSYISINIDVVIYWIKLRLIASTIVLIM